MKEILIQKTCNIQTVVNTLLLLCLACVAFYMYGVASAVTHVVMRAESEQQVQKLRSEISQLEAEYIAAQHRVSQHISMLEGYDEVVVKTFIDRRSPSLVMGRN